MRHLQPYGGIAFPSTRDNDGNALIGTSLRGTKQSLIKSVKSSHTVISPLWLFEKQLFSTNDIFCKHLNMNQMYLCSYGEIASCLAMTCRSTHCRHCPEYSGKQSHHKVVNASYPVIFTLWLLKIAYLSQ